MDARPVAPWSRCNRPAGPASGPAGSRKRPHPLGPAALAILVLGALPPSRAGADYLPSGFRDSSVAPYVMFVLDTSESMDHEPRGGKATDSYVQDGATVCPYGATSGTDSCHCRYECTTWRRGNCVDWTRVCDTCPTQGCKTRGEAAKEVLGDLIANLDGAEMGLIHFRDVDASPEECGRTGNRNHCGRQWIASPGSGDNRQVLLDAIARAPFDSYTPLALALRDARTHLQAVADADPEASCRGYYVILLTDGENTCCGDPETAATELRSVSTANGTIDIRTFVIGFGRDVAGSESLSGMARAGGTARLDGQWECWDPTGRRTDVPSTCSRGTALFAGDSRSLEEALDEIVAAIRSGLYTTMSPVIGSVPQRRSETDRVARNFMAYTAFEMPGYKGHVFGVRLFEETAPGSSSWKFTDLTGLDLLGGACGVDRDSPCVFDAGRRLFDRVNDPAGRPRRIWTAEVADVVHQDAAGAATERTDLGVTLVPKSAPLWLTDDGAGKAALKTAAEKLAAEEPFGSLLADTQTLAAIAADYPDHVAALTADEDMFRGTLLAWLHGDPALRPWPLGDPYHGGATIVEAPPYAYRTLGYPRFARELGGRPHMVYVPTNDGMIHAFHAGPDLAGLRQANRDAPTCEAPERWCPGDEAWAHLPASLLYRTAVEVLGGAERFFSMDLACRVDDVLVHDLRTEDGGVDCDRDPDDAELCGWRTVLLCGQGWGGNWLVALDVSRPLEPRPLWEMTFDEGNLGFGRTWSLPGVALLHRDGLPRWVAVVGNGYNTDLADSTGVSRRAYRLLNLPFAGAFAHHGNGTVGDRGQIYALDVASGRFVKRFDTPSLGAVIADIPVVDVDADGFTETAYAAGWKGEIHRLSFGGDGALAAAPPSSWSYCSSMFKFPGIHPVPNRPVVMADPLDTHRLYLVAASGRDKGDFPDEATNHDASYDLDGWHFDDTGGLACGSWSLPRGNGGGGNDGGSNNGGGNNGGGGAGNSNMCKHGDVRINQLFTGGANKRRLLGAPIIAAQGNGERWLSFTTWDPPDRACGGDGEGTLYCLKWSDDPGTCGYCGDLNDDGEVGTGDRDLRLSGTIPAPPISADGQLYVTTPDGLQRVGNQGGDGTGANREAPRRVVLSWREVFPAPPTAPAAAPPPASSSAEP